MVIPMLPMPKVSAAITVATYEEKVAAFLADSKYKHGLTWADGKTPNISGWKSWGCCAYCADFVAYVYGSKKSAWTTKDFYKYTDINDIKKGDVVHITGHWLVVLDRNGNSLKTAEGNFDDKVRVTSNGWSIKDGKLYNIAAKKKCNFEYGYHYKFADATYSFGFNASGGEGSIASKKMSFGDSFSLPTSGFTKAGFSFAGWNAYRSDGKWYVGNGNGWLDEATMKSKGLTPRLYAPDDTTYKFNSSWTTGLNAGATYTFHAVWKTTDHTVYCFDNYSEVNYLHDAAFTEEIDSFWWNSRDTSVLTVNVDSEVKRTPKYNTLRIDSLAPGVSGKDLAIRTYTRGSAQYDANVGETKEMILGFWAKTDTDGMSMLIRWGYEPTNAYRKVTLTKEWQFYTVRMDKQAVFGNYMHPYFDKAGTVWFSEMQLEDGTEATKFKNDTQGYQSVLVKDNGTYDTLPILSRDGYTFDGWYTSASGGDKVDASTAAPSANNMLYAHWTYVNPFNDVPEKKWYYNGAMYASEMGYMAGTNAERTTFSPDMKLTREQFVQVLFNMEGLSAADYEGPTGFNDVPEGKWYSAAVKWAKESGVSNGDGKGNFLLGSDVTREQLAQFLMNYSKLKGMNTELDVDMNEFQNSRYYGIYVTEDGTASGIVGSITEQLSIIAAHNKFKQEIDPVDFYLDGYTDAPTISRWAKKAVAWAISEGIFTSTGADVKTVSPARVAMRSEIAKITMTFDEYITR